MGIFSNITILLSAIMIVFSGILFTVYSNEFFLRKAPLEWHIVSAGMIFIGITLFIRPLVRESFLQTTWPILISSGSIILALAFARLYTKSIKEAIK